MENQKLSITLLKHESKKAEWKEKIIRCRNSGQKVKDWCAENEINEKTYYRWQRLIWDEETKKGIELTQQKTTQFVEIPNIKLESERNSAIIIKNGAWQIEMNEKANAETICRILETVAQYV